MLLQIDSNSVHAAPATRGRILVAEDDRQMRKLITLALQRDGFEVTQAASGLEALARIGDAIDADGHSYYDLVVSDIRMPGPSGLELLAGLRLTDWSVPFVLVTAFGDADTHVEARRLGAIAVLDKPFSLDELRWIVSRLVPWDGA